MAQYPMSLPVGSAISLNGYEITEHNRAPIQIGFSTIEKTKMMASGLTRRFLITQKRSLQLSWSMVPSTSAMTVDGKYGAKQIRDLYTSTFGTFTVTIKYNNATTDSIYMYATDASFEVVKRNVKATVSSSPEEFWNVSLTLEEV